MLQCIDDHARWESGCAGYDVKVGLLACYRVENALKRMPLAASATGEIKAIESLLKRLMSSKDLLEGEYSTEAASIGAILGRFSAGIRSISADELSGRSPRRT